MLKRVVVTGIGTINPLGADVESYFSNLDKGVSGACTIDRFDTNLFKSHFACQIPGYDPEDFGFDRKEARKNDRYTQYAVIAADQAFKDSGLVVEEEDKYRIGVVIGTGVGGIESITAEVMEYEEDQIPRFSPFLIPKVIPNIASGVVSIKYGLCGPNHAVSTACASATHAMGVAAQYIQMGMADAIICGGAEAAICPSGIGGFCSSKALSTNNDEYLTASRPYDATRDGFVMGEGAGILVLEDYDHAVRRGARIYAEIAGYGFTSDAYHITAPDPEGKGASVAMQLAIKSAGIVPSDIQYINAHGTSTKLGDIAELNAIKNVFGDAAYNVNISATKSMTGHLLGAAGGIEAIACIHTLRDGIIPPTINFKEEDPDIDYRMKLTLNSPEHRPVEIAMSNNFGFGGQNACMVFKKI